MALLTKGVLSVYTVQTYLIQLFVLFVCSEYSLIMLYTVLICHTRKVLLG